MNNNNNHPLHLPSTSTTTNRITIDDIASGQQALDQLLASLAIESDVNDQHLENIVNKNNNNNNNYAMTSRLAINDHELSAIIADLTEFGSQHSSSGGDSGQWTKITNGGDSNGSTASDRSDPLMNQTIKKLTDVSDCSSSISPSLSERSNGVSWSDQVKVKDNDDDFSSSLFCFIYALFFLYY